MGTWTTLIQGKRNILKIQWILVPDSRLQIENARFCEMKLFASVTCDDRIVWSNNGPLIEPD